MKIMKSYPKISVIIPVYKAENYLAACIDRVLTQTFGDFELLLILDGSFDRSELICIEYAQKDSRIRIFKEEHMGVAYVRQVGLNESKGDYIIYVDADDEIESTYLEELYNKAIDDGTDMVICDYVELTNEGTIEKSQQPSELTGIAYLNDILSGKCYGALWNKLMKRTTVLKSSSSFPINLSMREDLVFLSNLLPYISKLSYIPRSLYRYERRNAGSLTNNYLNESVQYYNQEVTWNSLILRNKYLSSEIYMKMINYYHELAYITLKSDLFTQEKWNYYFLPFKKEFNKVGHGYKGVIVKVALTINFHIARKLRNLISKLTK